MVVTGPMESGPPAYDYEIWIANALLSVTFPFLIFLAAYFAYWPLARRRAGGRGRCFRAGPTTPSRA